MARQGSLAPFPGAFVPGLTFESGHAVWLLDFSSTPTDHGAYTELWLIEPDGERVLYVDPGAAAGEVTKYHDFDRVEGGTISHERRDHGEVHVGLDGEDGTQLDLELYPGGTVGTALLTAVIRWTPDRVLRSRLGTWVSTRALNLLVEANGLRVAGRTETGRRYRLDADRIRTVADASGTLDDRDLGRPVAPEEAIEFGDAKTTADPLYVQGTLNLERRAG